MKSDNAMNILEKTTSRERELYTELARRLMIAYGSNWIGVGMDYYRKQYQIDDQQIGDFWILLAKNLSISIMEDLERKLTPS